MSSLGISFIVLIYN